jgi:GPH family glycoside/pentoside/hexuronide:cation symporter
VLSFLGGADSPYALSYIDKMVELTQKKLQGKKVIVTETGWPSVEWEASEPSSSNAMKYFISVQEWAKNQNIEVFYFSSFDESWKVKQEGEVGLPGYLG